LWSQSPEKLIHEFIDLGFKARIVSCQADSLDQSFIGRWIDRDVVSEMKSMGICPCGENGEFHTLVVDGPLFKKKIDLVETEPVLKEGFWKYWFLDIKQFRCIPKHNKKEKEK
ncbi:MAG: hypothetical protein JW774_05535, partial [Candidatus Aureabacteria bacterium]|nr:hypothetical protein [Candidatus Auribacterota bacterium]